MFFNKHWLMPMALALTLTGTAWAAKPMSIEAGPDYHINKKGHVESVPPAKRQTVEYQWEKDLQQDTAARQMMQEADGWAYELDYPETFSNYFKKAD